MSDYDNNVKRTNAYKTTDGLIFEELECALRQQRALDWQDWYRHNFLMATYNNVVEVEDLTAWLETNRETVLQFLGIDDTTEVFINES